MNILVTYTPRNETHVDILVREIITRDGVAKYSSEKMDAEYTTSYCVGKQQIAAFLASLFDKYACDLGYNNLFIS